MNCFLLQFYHRPLWFYTFFVSNQAGVDFNSSDSSQLERRQKVDLGKAATCICGIEPVDLVFIKIVCLVVQDANSMYKAKGSVEHLVLNVLNLFGKKKKNNNNNKNWLCQIHLANGNEFIVSSCRPRLILLPRQIFHYFSSIHYSLFLPLEASGNPQNALQIFNHQQKRTTIQRDDWLRFSNATYITAWRY